MGVLLVAVGNLERQTGLVAMRIDGACGRKREGLAQYSFAQSDVGN